MPVTTCRNCGKPIKVNYTIDEDHDICRRYTCIACGRWWGDKVLDMIKLEGDNDADNEPVNDPVNHPKHYANGMTVEVECNMFKRWLPADLSDAFKYIWRAGNKDDLKQDISKASWYLKDALEYGITCEHYELVDFLPKNSLEEWKYQALRHILTGGVGNALEIVDAEIDSLTAHFNTVK